MRKIFLFPPPGNPPFPIQFSVQAEAGANGGQVLVSGRSPSPVGDTPYASTEIKEYQLNFTQAGIYYFWARGKGANNAQNSIFFTVDNQPWKAWYLNVGAYTWTKTMQVGTTNSLEITTPGIHTVKIAMREKQARLDGFYITSDSSQRLNNNKIPQGAEILDPSADCPGAFWIFEPNLIAPSCFQGYSPESTTLTITNADLVTGSGAAAVAVNNAWVSVSPSTIPALGPGESATLTVRFNATALPPGIHQSMISVTGNANNSPLTVQVNLLVKDAPQTAACGEVPLYAQSIINPAIMVMLDTSGSMGGWMTVDGTYRKQIDVAEDAIKEAFLDQSIAWGFSTWAGSDGVGGHSFDNNYTNIRIGVRNHDQAHQAALQQIADDGIHGGGTPLSKALNAGVDYFTGQRTDGYYNEIYTQLDCQPKIVLFITDGFGNWYTTNQTIDYAVDRYISKKVSIVTVGFNLDNEIQLNRIAQRFQRAVETSNDNKLYDLHKKVNGLAVPYMVQNRQEFIDALNDIVSSVKAQIFHGASPAATTSADNKSVLLTSSFSAADWTGDITATEYDLFTGVLKPASKWSTSKKPPADPSKWFIFDHTVAGKVANYTDASINGDSYGCRPQMGDIINSTPAIVGAPPYFYPFNNYFGFKYDQAVRGREEMVYVAANDGALHAFTLADGIEKWRFYPESVKAGLAAAGTAPQKDRCASAYCHEFLLDGSPEPTDIYVNDSIGWRTILTTGQGRGGPSLFALDITYGESFDAPDKTVGGTSVDVKTKFLWEFTDPELGMATSPPTVARVHAPPNSSGWATFFGSGKAMDPIEQAGKEAYLFAIDAWDKSHVWVGSGNAPVNKIKLSSTPLGNDACGPVLALDTQNDSFKADRIYAGNLYGNLYRVKDIGFDQAPVAELLFNAEKSDHSTPVTGKPASGFAGANNYWIYFGTGQYDKQIDKLTDYQQYLYGLYDEGASRSTPYNRSDLVSYTAGYTTGYAVGLDGEAIDANGDGIVDAADIQTYRTLTCDAGGAVEDCNPGKESWMIKLSRPTGKASERIISHPLVTSGIVTFTTFIPGEDVCESDGETWLFSVDWETGGPKAHEVFKDKGAMVLPPNGEGDPDETATPVSLVGFSIGSGRPAGDLAIDNNNLFVDTTDSDMPPQLQLNLPDNRARLKAWRQNFK